MIKPWSFIVNSRIADSKKNELLTAIQHHFSEALVDIQYTKYGGHALQLANECVANNVTHLIAVGGDGTVNEVLQAIVHTNTILGIIPCGSGNGLARHCGIPLQITKAVAMLQQSVPKKVDVGKANTIYFISNAGVGFDATVCNAIQQSTSRGLKMYIYQTLRQLWKYAAANYQINCNNTTYTQKAFMITVANGKELGYGFQLAPSATMQDGYLDMVVLQPLSFFGSLDLLVDAWLKKWTSDKNKTHTRSKYIRIQSKQMLHFQTDGDAHPCQGECIFTMEENALHLLVPSTLNDM
jgi:diacylglycerol kinase (ATP)